MKEPDPGVAAGQGGGSTGRYKNLSVMVPEMHAGPILRGAEGGARSGGARGGDDSASARAGGTGSGVNGSSSMLSMSRLGSLGMAELVSVGVHADVGCPWQACGRRDFGVAWVGCVWMHGT